MPGPRCNMKEVPGSFTLTMLVVHGYHLYLMPLFSETGDWRTSVLFPPTPDQPWQSPPPLPLQVPTPPPAKMNTEASLIGNHTSASDLRSEAMDWARGGYGDHFGLFSASLGGQAADIETSAGRPAQVDQRASLWQIRNSVAGQYNQDKSMASRYGTGVYIRNPCVPSPHSATTPGGDHVSIYGT
jgi:hypothetical protein